MPARQVTMEEYLERRRERLLTEERERRLCGGAVTLMTIGGPTYATRWPRPPLNGERAMIDGREYEVLVATDSYVVVKNNKR